MSAHVYLEGGGDSNDGRRRCRQGFRRLLEKCGFKGRMPKLTACGDRKSAYDDFVANYSHAPVGDYVALLIDSEDPIQHINTIWQHLQRRDGWEKPPGADDEQVLLMTTCMETWLVADRDALSKHYGQHLQTSALPTLDNLESRARGYVQERLERATRNCQVQYAKGPESFKALSKINPEIIQWHLPSFRRAHQILDARL